MAAPQIQKLEEIIATSTDPVTVAKAQEMLDQENRRLASIGSAQVQAAAMSGVGDADVVAVLEAIKSALKSSGTGTVNMADLRKAVSEELAIRKITENDLSKDLISLLNSSRKVNLTINKMLGVTLTKEVKASTLERPLVQLLLSDLMARNNVYLYGGAGTGKTYLAEQIAEMLGWTAITLNCNQFTSPIDILGGQTITGYQEGKVSMAWSNQIVNEDGTTTEVDGCVLILDELPKIDPNTAGILNEALAKVKDFKYDEQTKTYKSPTIRNGKNKVLPLKNLFVIATGNVALNTIDPDYEANFKQDLSLQDRFIGSTYKVFVDYDYEFNVIMSGFAFIWIFLIKVRQAIQKNIASGQAFVSLRLMINVKATYVAYREVKNNITLVKGNVSNQAISNPKTIIQSMETFFTLFKDVTRDAIVKEVDFEGFKKIVADKDLKPYDPEKPNFDNLAEIKEAKKMIEDYKATQTGI